MFNAWMSIIVWELRGRGRPIRQKTLINHKQYPFKSKKTLSYAYTLTSLCLMPCLIKSKLELQALCAPPQDIGATFCGATLGFWPFAIHLLSSSHQLPKKPFPKDLQKSFHPGFPFTPASFIGISASHAALHRLLKSCWEPLLCLPPCSSACFQHIPLTRALKNYSTSS